MSTLVFIFRLTIFAAIFAMCLAVFVLVKRRQAEALPNGTADWGVANAVSTAEPLEHPGRAIFRQNCIACHHLDRTIIGPPLRHSFQMRDSAWLVKMIINPMALIKSGDTAAVNVFNRYGQITAVTFTNFSRQEISDLVEYLKLEGEDAFDETRGY